MANNINIGGQTYDLSTQSGRADARTNNPGLIVDATSAYNPSTGQQQNASSGGGGNQASPGTPAPVTSASAAQLQAGVNQLLAAAASGNKAALDETIREFNSTFGLDTNKFNDDVRRFNENLAISQAGLTGTYQGQSTLAAQLQAANIAAQQAGLTGTFQGAPTLAAQAQYAAEYGGNGMAPGAQTLAAQLQYANLYGGAGAAPTANQTTLAAQQQAYTQQMGAVNAAAALQANPFRQAQVIGQAGRILQGMPTAGFQAPTTVAGVGTQGGNTQGGMGYLQQLIDDIKSPQANQTTAQSWLNATPTPNKIDSASFLRSTPTTQNLILQSMQEKYGLDPQDSLKQIQNTLPQFNAPSTVGTVRRG